MRLACSIDTDEFHLSIRNGALRTLNGLLRQNKFMGVQVSVFSLSNLAAQLQSWVPLSSQKDVKEGRKDSDSTTKNFTLTEEETRSNATGLESFFTIWYTAFDADQVTIGDSGAEDATTCLVSLAKMSLDYSVHSTDM